MPATHTPAPHPRDDASHVSGRQDDGGNLSGQRQHPLADQGRGKEDGAGAQHEGGGGKGTAAPPNFLREGLRAA